LVCRSVARERVLNLPLPWMITQQSSFELCFAISSPVSFTACVSLLSWFIVANGVCPSCVVRGYRRTMLYRCVVWSQDISAIVVQIGVFHKEYKDGGRAANQSTSNEKETQIGAANLFDDGRFQIQTQTHTACRRPSSKAAVAMLRPSLPRSCISTICCSVQ
jgi:hypothetical protein